MATFTLQFAELGDPVSFDPDGTPGAGDTVIGTSGIGGRNGSLDVERVENLWIANNATVTANSADSITVGNFQGTGGAVMFTINGTVSGGTTVVWSNGSLEADAIATRIQNRGGTITINNDYNVDGDSNSVDLSLQDGTTTITGSLNFVGTQSIVDVDDNAVLSANGIDFGTGRSSIAVTDGGEANITGAGTLALIDNQQVFVDSGGTFTASQLDVTITGSSFTQFGDFAVHGSGSVGEAEVASLDVSGHGVARVNGGKLTVNGDVDIGVTADDGQVEVSDFSGPFGTFKAQNVTVGNAMSTVDHYGDWEASNTGTSGALLVGNRGYVTIGETLTLDNADDFGLSISATGSVHVGGDGGYVAGQLLVDGSGSIAGHGTISAPTIIVNGGGTIGASAGTLTIDSEVTGTGTLLVDDSAILRLTDAVSVDVEFLARADTSLAHSSILMLDDPGNFTGSITGLSAGTTIVLEGNALGDWTGLNNPLLSHTEIQAGQLIMTFIDDGPGNINTGTPGSVSRTFDIAGDLADHTFVIRDLGFGDIGLSFTDASNQILTDVDGTPTNGANPYIDSLVNGWGAWDQTAGPITYWFGTASDVQAAIDVHGESTLLVHEQMNQLNGWSQDEMNAFTDALDVIAAATGLTFAQAGSVTDANLTWWQRPMGGGTLGVSDFPSQVPNGHLWQVFDHRFWDSDTLSFGGDGNNTIIHEIGHGLGLAHPHDGGLEPDLNRFPGVPFGFDQAVGLNAQNQAIFTVMSYRQGWTGKAPPPLEYGTQGGLGAFDIAALQELYGANLTHNAGDGDQYALPTVNAPGTGWFSIWDAGGVEDEITNAGSNLNATIDLRAAPLVGANAGGFVSHVGGILGGFTIANGVVIENAIGGNGHDRLIGNAEDNRLEGGNGNDTLIGGAGVDTLIGGRGNDTYDIFSLDDIIMEFASEGRDVVRSSGIDLSLSDFNFIEDLTLQGMAGLDLTGNASANKLTGNAGGNKIIGNGGNDTLIGNGGNDHLQGGIGNDILQGNRGNDTALGGAGKDNIKGLAGKDILKGGAGNDIIVGGLQSDTLFGGTGRDIFDFNGLGESRKGVAKRDKLMDFTHQDDIDLRTIDAKSGVGGNQKFKFIGKNQFHDTKGELRYVDKGNQVIVQGDVNGDGKADFEIFVKIGWLKAGDFLL